MVAALTGRFALNIFIIAPTIIFLADAFILMGLRALIIFVGAYLIILGRATFLSLPFAFVFARPYERKNSRRRL